MDVEEALRQLRWLCDDAENGENVAEGLAERFRALDGWLSSGGFLPSAWTPGNGNARSKLSDLAVTLPPGAGGNRSRSAAPPS